MKTAIRLVEKGYVPKPLMRHGIRRLLRDRLSEQQELFGSNPEQAMRSFMQRRWARRFIKGSDSRSTVGSLFMDLGCKPVRVQAFALPICHATNMCLIPNPSTPNPIPGCVF